MSGLIPFNHSNLINHLGFDDFHNMLDDFFGGGFTSFPSRNLLKDTFKIDIQQTDTEYRIEAELPGIKKEEINLNVEDDNLCISVNRAEETEDSGKNYIHRERRSSSMSRRVKLVDSQLDQIKAKLEGGVLIITVPKVDKTVNSRKIEIE